MTTNAELHRANSDPVATAELLLLEFWEQGRPEAKEYAAINNEDVVSNGVTYRHSSISVALPSTSDDSPSLSISVSNIERVVGRRVLSTKLPLIVRIMEINSADPDTILRDTYDMLILSDATVTAQTVSGSLVPQLDPLEPFPLEGVRAEFFPGL